ncbi:GNAT family N-acetyltransferase [Oerskovia sp. Sa1BUA8]|uniref:GNAT family N-acetyltransferase n=1 Tax=Oerskovia douganii TaxID=2762210 RepID=A0A9D5UDP0_9CELL|nr:GNAT family N-acetyltransferase [Oerskovia douganii]MBE7699062.1 GNAT family N-acetyltransferase [Oerskovia douganii]
MIPSTPAPDLFELRPGLQGDAEQCVGVWVEASAARDGRHVEGVAARARGKFDRRVAWTVATDSAGGVVGFALATRPGSGIESDPPESPVLGLLAVDPRAQGSGLGRRLLEHVTELLAGQGYSRAVLHVLTDNAGAVGLYERDGWVPWGDPVEHSLLRRDSQTYVRDLTLAVHHDVAGTSTPSGPRA